MGMLTCLDCARCLSAARTNVMSVVTTLKAMRSEESFDRIWLNICKSANELQLSQPAMPRQQKTPKRLDDGAAPHEYLSTASCHHIQTWFAFLDIVINEINERFSQECFKPLANVENVLLRAANVMSVSDELQQLAVFYDDFN